MNEIHKQLKAVLKCTTKPFILVKAILLLLIKIKIITAQIYIALEKKKEQYEGKF